MIKTVSTNLTENINRMKQTLSIPENFDVVLREFKVRFSDRYVDAFLVYYDGMSQQSLINLNIIYPMQSGIDKSSSENREENVYGSLIAAGQLSKVYEWEQIIDGVEFGECAIFVDGCSCAFVADTKGWEKRGVSEPTTEASLSGPQEAFNETIMPNIALIRKIVKDPNLIAEKISIGTKSKTPCALMYISNIANNALVSDVRYRLNNIDLEYLISVSEVEQLIEDGSFYPAPQILKTERPDKAASALSDGRCVVIVQGSPFVMVLPSVALDFIEASEDNYVRFPAANFMRLVRLFGAALALFLPAFFIAVSLYHHDIIPADLLLSIEATREGVPFPIFVELILMELSFELIKEASVRIPSPVGSTIGIIGGLILGQAAVEANIVSPILIIVVSIAGLGSFSVPSLALSRSIGVMRFAYTIAAALGGFVGIISLLLINIFYLGGRESFGTSYLAPISGFGGNFFIRPVWKKELRPAILNAKSVRKQPHKSKKWEE